jgi:membrane protein insertase Oxa1/YidC/SpoIIIJ
MPLWDQVVEIVRQSVFAYAQACNGSLGAGILAVTFLARLALLPLGIRLARQAALQSPAMATPPPPSPGGWLGSVSQAPVVIALYSGVRRASAIGGRFLWIRDLAKPDWALVIIATALTLLAAASGAAPAQGRSLVLGISAVVTLMVLWKMSAGVALYWSMSSLFGAVQGWAVQRSLPGRAA